MKDQQIKFILVISLLFLMMMNVYLSDRCKIDKTSDGKDKLLEDIKKYKKQVDSLESEIFIMNTQWNRFEITTEYIFNKYPQIKNEYYEYYEHETE
jgi:hypothetical protein